MYHYPYGSSQQLNLDWLINAWRTYQRQIEDMIAPQYSNSTEYDANSLVIYDHVFYYNPDPISPAEEWDPDHWIQLSIADIFMGNI